jgi:16S rRNA (cytosine967-C5)-methyltransferase
VPQHSARRIALTALRSWRKRKQFADVIVAKLLESENLSPQERAFALELFYGVLRNLTLLDFWTELLRPSSLDVDLKDVVRLGLYQLLSLNTAEHAGVYETVELAPARHRSVINGILRSAVRRKTELLEKSQTEPIEVRTSHPRFLIDRWQQNFGVAATEALAVWDNQPPPIYARINRLKISVDEFKSNYPQARAVANASNFFEFNAVPIEALKFGHCYVQDASTAIACELLDPKPGENILDACAAPGGKAGYLADLMNNRGAIVACDRESKRMAVLNENLERLGVTNGATVLCDWTAPKIADEIANHAPFDRILVDAPCTNTGVMRRRVDLRWRLRPGDVIRMQKRQLAIIRRVLALLKTNGVLVYSTCSLEPEENEKVIELLLAEMSMVRLETQKICLPFREGFDGAFAARLIKTA